MHYTLGWGGRREATIKSHNTFPNCSALAKLFLFLLALDGAATKYSVKRFRVHMLWYFEGQLWATGPPPIAQLAHATLN